MTKNTKNSVSNKARNNGQILGTNIISNSKPRVLRELQNRLAGWDQNNQKSSNFLVVTPNPEIILAARKDKVLRKTLNSAQISIPDGVGSVQAMKFLELWNPKNKLVRLPVLLIEGLWVGLSTIFNRDWLFSSIKPIKGRELVIDLIKIANKKGWRVFLLGGRSGVSKKAKGALEQSYKKVKLKADDGPELSKSGNPVQKEHIKLEKDIVRSINEFKPHLLFVAFGAPKQEKWLAKRLPDLKVGVAMTVGGTFDYLAGKKDLPPVWMESWGLEWIWRLFSEPSLERFVRILKAFPIFPLKVFWDKFMK